MKSINIQRAGLLATAAILGHLGSAQAGLIFTVEAPGVQESTVPGAITETFDDGDLNSAIGTYVGGTVVPADGFGGANGTSYHLVGIPLDNTTSTLTFAAPQSYFGLWWSAGDISNILSFYDPSDVLLGTYNVGDIIPLLDAGYYGNPDTGENAAEAYAYLNFTATAGSKIQKVVFQNGTGSGFESDNHSIFESPITPPGNPIGTPEAGSLGLMLLTSVGALAAFRRASK